MTATQHLSLRQIHGLAKQGKQILVKTPYGLQKVGKVFLNGKKQVHLINGKLPVTGQHILYNKDDQEISALQVKAGDYIKGENPQTQEIENVKVFSVDSLGVREVGDIHVEHQAHRYIANGFVVSNCGSCESKQEIAHLSSKHKRIERGKDWIEKLEAIHRDDQPAQKLLVEVWQEGGIYSAMVPNFIRHGVNRAILKAGWELGWDLVEALIYERHANTKQLYRLKDDNFRSMVAGSSIFEVAFNSSFVFTKDKADALFEVINKYVTKGWRIKSIKPVSGDFILKANVKHALVTYRFDSRKVNTDVVNLPLLKKLIKSYPNRIVKYKEQHRLNKQVVKNKTVAFDKSRTLDIAAGTGRNPYEIVLRVLTEIENVHPLIWLAGFLSEQGSPRAYMPIYGTDICVEGFYTGFEQRTHSVFDVGQHEQGISCPKCGGQKAINIMSGKPFGEEVNEQDEILAYKYGKVCQSCFMKEAI